MMQVQIDASDITNFRDYLVQFPKQTPRALSIAINDTMRDVVIPRGRELMREQVRFPEGFLENPNKFKIAEYAKPESLIGWVKAEDRGTSLARFADVYTPTMQRRDPWIPVSSIEVHPGATKNVSSGGRGKMFLIPLRRGSDWGNVGLAIRLRKGEKVENVREFNPIQLSEKYPNVYILYGPSVDQIFKSVAVELMPEVTSYMKQEFNRQMDRLLGGVNLGPT